MSSSNPLNVLRQPLQFFSRQPMTGFYRDGYCRTGAADFGKFSARVEIPKARSVGIVLVAIF